MEQIKYPAARWDQDKACSFREKHETKAEMPKEILSPGRASFESAGAVDLRYSSWRSLTLGTFRSGIWPIPTLAILQDQESKAPSEKPPGNVFDFVRLLYWTN